jgi:hypothetical protein
VGAGVHDLDCQFVTQNARVGEERLASAVGMQVGPADADATHPHQYFTSLAFGNRHVFLTQAKWLGECYLLHARKSPAT